jgi:hypothetical protein
LIFSSLSAVAVAIASPSPDAKKVPNQLGDFLDTPISSMLFKIPCRTRKVRGNFMKKKSKMFDIIVLAGMVVNILLAVFLILYYFDFL